MFIKFNLIHTPSQQVLTHTAMHSGACGHASLNEEVCKCIGVVKKPMMKIIQQNILNRNRGFQLVAIFCSPGWVLLRPVGSEMTSGTTKQTVLKKKICHKTSSSNWWQPEMLHNQGLQINIITAVPFLLLKDFSFCLYFKLEFGIYRYFKDKNRRT